MCFLSDASTLRLHCCPCRKNSSRARQAPLAAQRLQGSSAEHCLMSTADRRKTKTGSTVGQQWRWLGLCAFLLRPACEAAGFASLAHPGPYGKQLGGATRRNMAHLSGCARHALFCSAVFAFLQPRPPFSRGQPRAGWKTRSFGNVRRILRRKDELRRGLFQPEPPSPRVFVCVCPLLPLFRTCALSLSRLSTNLRGCGYFLMELSLAET